MKLLLLLCLFMSISLCSHAGETRKQSALKLWSDLVEMNPKKSKKIGKFIQIAGYILPIGSSDFGTVNEFFLTPIPGGCVHTPPPPPSYLVHVKLKRGKKIEITKELVEVAGKLEMAKDSFGYEMNAEGVYFY